jgi:hypothetical protein
MSPGRTGFGRPRAGATDSGFCRWLARGPPGGFGRRGVLRCHPGGFGHRKEHRDEAGRRNRLPRNRPAEPSGVPRAGGSGGRGREPATRCAGGRWRFGASGHGRRRFGVAGQPGFFSESLPLQVRRKRGTTGKPRFALGDGSPVGSQDWLRGPCCGNHCTQVHWGPRAGSRGRRRGRAAKMDPGGRRACPQAAGTSEPQGFTGRPADAGFSALRCASARGGKGSWLSGVRGTGGTRAYRPKRFGALVGKENRASRVARLAGWSPVGGEALRRPAAGRTGCPVARGSFDDTDFS